MSDKNSAQSIVMTKEILLARAAIERAECISLLNAARMSRTSWGDILACGVLLFKISQFFRANSVLRRLSRAMKAMQFLASFVTKFKFKI